MHNSQIFWETRIKNIFNPIVDTQIKNILLEACSKSQASERTPPLQGMLLPLASQHKAPLGDLWNYNSSKNCSRNKDLLWHKLQLFLHNNKKTSNSFTQLWVRLNHLVQFSLHIPLKNLITVCHLRRIKIIWVRISQHKWKLRNDHIHHYWIARRRPLKIITILHRAITATRFTTTIITPLCTYIHKIPLGKSFLRHFSKVLTIQQIKINRILRILLIINELVQIIGLLS